MASPMNSSIVPAEEAARSHNFAEQLRTRLRPYASHYRYHTLLRLLDRDPVPESPGVVGEEGPEFGESRSAGSSALVVQANSLFREWKQLSIDLLADKNSQSEAIIHDETERLRKEIEAQAKARALAAGELISSSGPASPDAVARKISAELRSPTIPRQWGESGVSRAAVGWSSSTSEPL
ncbi:hypothetical protein FRC04_011182 [Tulasnella sp. 424]|nr:hypothetical protein FRC04_011182 [Tulasnella sp. 424]